MWWWMVSTAAAATPMPASVLLGYGTCDTCEDPAAAVVLGTVSEGTVVSRGTSGAPLGYPVVVHSEQLAPVDGRQGLLVIGGLFVSLRGADEWLAAHPMDGAGVVALRPADAQERALDRQYADRELTEIPSKVAVRVDHPGGALAFARDAVHAGSGETPTSAPLCTVPDGAVFVATRSDLLWYDWAPVFCGDAPAYVAWTATRLTSTVFQHADGDWRIRQVVGAECDSPLFELWAYSEAGRGAVLVSDRPPPTEPLGGHRL